MDPLVNSEININRYIAISHIVCLTQMLNSSEFYGLYQVCFLSKKGQSVLLGKPKHGEFYGVLPNTFPQDSNLNILQLSDALPAVTSDHPAARK